MDSNKQQDIIFYFDEATDKVSHQYLISLNI